MVEIPDSLAQKQLDADTDRVKTLTAEVKKARDDAKNNPGTYEAALKEAKTASPKRPRSSMS